MHYCLLIETNHKERETFIHYLQSDGNEEALQYLYQIVNDATEGSYELLGDVCKFEMGSPDMLISQEAVDQHLQFSDLGSYARRFSVCNGILSFPFDREDTKSMDSYELAVLLDDHFFACKIKNYFRKEQPPK